MAHNIFLNDNLLNYYKNSPSVIFYDEDPGAEGMTPVKFHENEMMYLTNILYIKFLFKLYDKTTYDIDGDFYINIVANNITEKEKEMLLKIFGKNNNVIFGDNTEPNTFKIEKVDRNYYYSSALCEKSATINMSEHPLWKLY